MTLLSKIKRLFCHEKPKNDSPRQIQDLPRDTIFPEADQLRIGDQLRPSQRLTLGMLAEAVAKILQQKEKDK